MKEANSMFGQRETDRGKIKAMIGEKNSQLYIKIGSEGWRSFSIWGARFQRMDEVKETSN